MVMTEDMDSGRPVSAQFPLSAAWKNGDANHRTSLCALYTAAVVASAARKEKCGDAPERRALNDDFDRPGELGLLRERLVDVDGLLRVRDAQLGNRVFGICFEEPRWRPRRGAEYPRGGSVCLCW
jgi:hypothetical protein